MFSPFECSQNFNVQFSSVQFGVAAPSLCPCFSACAHANAAFVVLENAYKFFVVEQEMHKESGEFGFNVAPSRSVGMLKGTYRDFRLYTQKLSRCGHVGVAFGDVLGGDGRLERFIQTVIAMLMLDYTINLLVGTSHFICRCRPHMRRPGRLR